MSNRDNKPVHIDQMLLLIKNAFLSWGQADFYRSNLEKISSNKDSTVGAVHYGDHFNIVNENITRSKAKKKLKALNIFLL